MRPGVVALAAAGIVLGVGGPALVGVLERRQRAGAAPPEPLPRDDLGDLPGGVGLPTDAPPAGKGSHGFSASFLGVGISIPEWAERNLHHGVQSSISGLKRTVADLFGLDKAKKRQEQNQLEDAERRKERERILGRMWTACAMPGVEAWDLYRAQQLLVRLKPGTQAPASWRSVGNWWFRAVEWDNQNNSVWWDDAIRTEFAIRANGSGSQLYGSRLRGSLPRFEPGFDWIDGFWSDNYAAPFEERTDGRAEIELSQAQLNAQRAAEKAADFNARKA